MGCRSIRTSLRALRRAVATGITRGEHANVTVSTLSWLYTCTAAGRSSLAARNTLTVVGLLLINNRVKLPFGSPDAARHAELCSHGCSIHRTLATVKEPRERSAVSTCRSREEPRPERPQHTACGVGSRM